MKFIEAIKALGPGQLLVSPIGTQHKIVDGQICYHDAKNERPLNNMGLIDGDGWQVIDKPRPRVKFADAMRAALDGKVIKSGVYGHSYCFKGGILVYSDLGLPGNLSEAENVGDWEILNPVEGGK